MYTRLDRSAITRDGNNKCKTDTWPVPIPTTCHCRSVKRRKRRKKRKKRKKRRRKRRKTK